MENDYENYILEPCMFNIIINAYKIFVRVCVHHFFILWSEWITLDLSISNDNLRSLCKGRLFEKFVIWDYKQNVYTLGKRKSEQ